MQSTAALVAWYGVRQPAALTSYVTWLHGELAALLPRLFVPRDPATVHSTVIGLDGVASADVEAFAAHLASSLADDPVTVRLGGFAPLERRLLSRGLPPYERGAVVSRGQVVVVGWPVDPSGAPLDRLDRLRREAAGFGITHRYPLDDGATDPDTHLVVGTLTDDPSASAMADALAAVRRLLADRPLHLPLTVDDLQVVHYDDPDLPLASTVAVPVAD